MIDPDPLIRIWWIVSGMLVLLMQCGFICLEMGCVKPRHQAGIAIKNFTMLITSSLVFTVFGARLLYGADVGGWGIIGWGPPVLPGWGSHDFSYGWLFFQVGFASIAATIVSGALAGRTKLVSNVVLAAVIAGVVYPIFGHWIWNPEGWLYRLGANDFAGSSVVHFVGGLAALIAAQATGHRVGWLDKSGRPQQIRNSVHLPFIAVGVVFLWIGWIGFNGGSVLPETVANFGFGTIGIAVLATCVAASAGGLSVIGIAALSQWRFGTGKGMSFAEALAQRLLFDPIAMLSGTMGGMVAVTANCNLLFEDPFLQHFIVWAIVIGAAGGFVAHWAARIIKEVLRIDDPVEAVAVHAGAGSAGMLIGGVFADNVGVQVLAVVAAGALTVAVVLPVVLCLKKMQILRSSPGEEAVGLTFEPLDAVIIGGTNPYRRRERSKEPSDVRVP